MKRIRVVALCVMSALVLSLLASCASAPRLEAGGKIAIVSYSLEKSIVFEGTSPDRGPGLLNPKDEDYYRYHKEAFASIWADFKNALPGIFGEERLVDIAKIEDNAGLLAATHVEPKLVMGQDTSPQSVYLFPAGLNYVNVMDAKATAAVASCIPSDYYLGVALKAEYFMWTGLSFGGVGGGVGKIRLYATVTIVNAKGKFLRQAQVVGYSTDTAPVVMKSMDPSNYPRLIAQAQQDLLPKLAKEVATW